MSGPPVTTTRKPASVAHAAAESAPAAASRFSVERGASRKAHRIGIYGPGGVGKTSLAAALGKVGLRPVFIDLDGGSADLDVSRVTGLRSYEDVLAALADKSVWSGYDTIVVDSASRFEDMCASHVIESVPTDARGTRAKSIEDYGYGKGYQIQYEAFLRFHAMLERHFTEGKNIVLIMHDTTAPVPNPQGEDFLRYEPRLLSPKSGKASTRLLVKEWVDHLLYIGYDVAVNRDGKAQGSGTRTIYCQELPTFWAKSRTLKTSFPYTEGSADVWLELFGDHTDSGKEG